MNQKRRKTTNFELYQLDEQYKKKENIINHINQAQDFFHGKQHSKGSNSGMIKLTLNFISMAEFIKASKICSTPIYFAFTADDNNVDCTALRQFDEYNCNKLRLKTSNLQSALNGFVNGTEVTFIHWDDDDTSYKGIYKGGLAEEHIDLRNFAVANPYIQSIQKQEWVMFWEDYPLATLKEMVEGKDEKEKKEKIEALEREGSRGTPDEYKDKELINHALCTMWTRFFRVDGEVYFECSTEDVNLFNYPHPLSRKVGKAIIKKVVDEYRKRVEKGEEPSLNQSLIPDYKVDAEDSAIPSSDTTHFTDKEYTEVKEKFSLYPFAVFRPYEKNRRFHGRSDVMSLIAPQMTLNYVYSMLAQCIQNNAYSKILVKPEALREQQITNEPSQVLYDFSGFNNSWGIKMLESQPLPNGLLEFASNLFALTREIHGFTEVFDGSITNQNVSGFALQQMINQANTTIEQQQQLFWVYNEEKAAIRLLYYKHYVDKAKYTTYLSDAEWDGEEQARKMLLNRASKGLLKSFPDAKPEDFEKETHRTKVYEITNDQIYGHNFDIVVEAMQGLSDSLLIEQQFFDNLLMNGGINNMNPEILNLYLQAAPNISPRTKASMKHIIANLEQNRCRQLENQLKDLVGKTQEIIKYAEQLESTVGYQGKFLDGLKKEFSNKITAQNNIINGLTKEMDKQLQNQQEMQSLKNDATKNSIKGTPAS